MTSQKTNVFGMNEAIHLAVLNPQGSKTFLKRILPTSVAFILHQRTDLDRNNFQTRNRKDIQYTIFKPKVCSQMLKSICRYVTGALDAIEKNYLREFYLIFCNRDDPTIIFESYKFQFKYLYNESSSPSNTSSIRQELSDSTDNLLKAIKSLDQYSQLKSGEIQVQIFLTYYDDVTPKSYEPPYFPEADEYSRTVLKNLHSHSKYYYQFGVLKTGFDMFKGRGKGDIFAIGESLSTTSNLVDELDKTDNLEESAYEDELVEDAIEINGTKFNKPSLNSTPINISDEEETTDSTCKIICSCQLGIKFRHTELVTCSQCFYRQHVFCMGYLHATDIDTKQYMCNDCLFSDLSQTNRDPQMERTKSLYGLVIGVTYISHELPEEILGELPSRFQYLILDKLQMSSILVEKDGKRCIDVRQIKQTHLKNLFVRSFRDRNKDLPDSINLKECDSQEEDSLIIQPMQKKRKHQK